MKCTTKLVLIGFVLAAGLGCAVSSFLPSGESSAASGDILFQDDFSDHNSGWDTWSNENSIVSYHDNGLRITILQPQYDYWSRPGRSYDNVIIEVDARLVNGPIDNDYGILCRYLDENNFYAFLISSDGYAGIMKMKEGTYETISGESLEYSDAIKVENQVNRISVDCSGSDLSLYVNGQEVQSAHDTDLTSGEVGLIAGTFDTGGVDILFDNFVVKKE